MPTRPSLAVGQKENLVASSDKRSTHQIEADQAAVLNRLTSSIEGLIDQVHPNRIKQRTVLRIKTNIAHEVDRAKAQVIDEQGNPRTERLAVFGGALAGLITLVLVIRRIGRRGRARRAALPKVGKRR